MTKHLISAIDEDGAEKIVSGLVTGLSDSTNGSKYGFSYSIAWEFFPGDFELMDAGDIIRLREWDIHTDISFGWSFDLSNILPDICTPRICVPLPFFGKVCTPRWCIDWPTIGFTVPLPTFFSEVSVDFSVQIEHDLGASQWVIKGVVNPITLDIDIVDWADTARVLFEDTLGAVLNGIPLIGPFLEDTIAWILSTVLDLIDDLFEFLLTVLSDSLGLHPVLGIGFELHRVDEIFEILPVSGPEPAVTVRITDLDAEITSDKELVVSADIAVP
ncbi:MAG: hypothetical protein WBF37_03900 [Dehalococcoidia bacterium]